MAAMASAEEHAQQEPTMMSEEELIELREVFKTEVTKMISELDHDGSGSIEFEEFALMMSSRTQQTSQEELLNAFKMFDKERNGIIERDELEHVLKTIGLEVTPEMVDEMMIVADPDGKGGVTFEDFQKIWGAGDGEHDDEDSVTDEQDAGGAS